MSVIVPRIVGGLGTGNHGLSLLVVWNQSPPARLSGGGVLGCFVQRVQDGHADTKRLIHTGWTFPVQH